MSLHVLFKVADADYVVPASAVIQMDSFVGATPVPGAPPYVAGIVQVRGRVVPVVDLRARFGAPPVERGIDARIIVVSTGDRQVGLLADAAREVVTIDEGQFEAPPDVIREQSGGFVGAIAQAGKRIVMRLRLEAVVTPSALPTASTTVPTAKHEEASSGQEQHHGPKA
jgi:purine-binding chemotaxis protein CheW